MADSTDISVMILTWSKPLSKLLTETVWSLASILEHSRLWKKWVNAFKESTGAKNIGVIVEDPSSGEILAMDGGDRYDLNDPRNLSSLYSADEIAAMNDSETMEL